MDMSNMGTPFYQEYMKKGNAREPRVQHPDRPEQRAPDEHAGSVDVRSPAFGGVASARGMAQFYQACLGLDELRIFPSAVRGWMQDIVIDGPDLTLKTPTAFSCGFMHDPADPVTAALRRLFGSGGFGHAGAGGSHAFADPSAASPSATR